MTDWATELRLMDDVLVNFGKQRREIVRAMGLSELSWVRGLRGDEEPDESGKLYARNQFQKLTKRKGRRR